MHVNQIFVDQVKCTIYNVRSINTKYIVLSVMYYTYQINYTNFTITSGIGSVHVYNTLRTIVL